MQLVFEALASATRRKIPIYPAHTGLSVERIASRFTMSKPSISQHLSILESTGPVTPAWLRVRNGANTCSAAKCATT